MKKLFLLLSVGILLCPLLSAAPLSGRLLGPDGQPLPFALVQVVGGRGATTADRDGCFQLETDVPAPFDLLVRRADGVYLEPVRIESLPAEGPLEIRTTAPLREEVLVASGSAELAIPPAAALTRIETADLQREAPRQITAVLAELPGGSQGGDGLAAVPTLRGLAQGRTLLQLDDGRITAERRAGPSASFLDLDSVGDVEVIRGPCSVAYGSDAFGGVIRARTRLPAPGDPAALRFALGGGTAGWERFGAAEATVPLAGGGLMAGGGFRKLDDYDSPEGTVPDSGGTLLNARAGYQREAGGGLLRALWRSDLGRDIGKPAASAGASRTLYPEENSHRLAVAYERPGPAGWSRLSVSGIWDAYRLVTRKIKAPAGGQDGSVTDADVDARDYGVRLEAERPAGPVRLLLGLDASGRFGLSADNIVRPLPVSGPPGAESVEVSIENARRNDLAAFTGAALDAGPVDLSGGIRLDRVTSRNDGGWFGDRSTAYTDWSGFLAAAVPLPANLEISLQAARGFRDALLSDRYYRGISGRGFITGNPDLLPETSAQFDLGLRYRAGGFAVAGYAYLYRIHDLIERYREGTDYFFRNRGTAEYRGLELEAAAPLPAGFRLQLAAHVEKGFIRGSDDYVDSIPPGGGVLTLRKDGRNWWWLGRCSAAVRDERPGPTERIVPGYAVLDTGAGIRFWERFELQVLLRNLLDQPYFNSTDVETVLAPGRSILVTLRSTLP